MMRKTPFALAALASALLGPGCVSWNVGHPESWTFDVDSIIRETGRKSECLLARAELSTLPDNRVSVQLTADFRDEVSLVRVPVTRTVEKQRRMTFGLFPRMASKNDRPKTKTGYSRVAIPEGPMAPADFICFPIGTIWSLFGPLLSGPWERSCFHTIYEEPPRKAEELFDRHNGWKPKPPSSFQVYRDFWKMPDSVRKEVNIWTRGEENKRSFSYELPTLFGFARGCHVYLSDRKEGSPVPAGTKMDNRAGVAVSGPLTVDFLIPELGLERRETIPSGQMSATFLLPVADSARSVAAEVVITEAAGRSAHSDTARAVSKVAGKRFTFNVALREQTEVPPTVPSDSRSSLENTYGNVRKSNLGNGEIEIRVEVFDNSGLNTLHIETELRETFKRAFRDAYLEMNPGESEEFIQTHYRWVTSEDGKDIVATGWAFSARPIPEGWHYDSGTRKGWIRLRVTGGIPAAEAERWAHNNIEEIVKFKNVVLEVGKAPPPGAQYRSLSEKFEAGVLTVEFEAIK